MTSMRWKDERMKLPYYPRNAPVPWGELSNLKNLIFDIYTHFKNFLFSQVLYYQLKYEKCQQQSRSFSSHRDLLKRTVEVLK